jgi:hypothetical protein
MGANSLTSPGTDAQNLRGPSEAEHVDLLKLLSKSRGQFLKCSKGRTSSRATKEDVALEHLGSKHLGRGPGLALPKVKQNHFC